MKNLNSFSTKKITQSTPIIYSTTKTLQKVVFYQKLDIEPAWSSKTKIIENVAKFIACENCGCVVSLNAKEIYTKFGFKVKNVCLNCGCNNSLSFY